MSKGKGTRRGGRPIVEDERLWAMVAEKVEPLRKAKRRVRTPAGMGENAQIPVEPLPRSRMAQAAGGERHTKAGEARSNLPKSARVAPAPRKGAPPLAELDRKRTRKLATGQMTIEARIDLHGMRQGEAHAALRAFLHQAQARGLRSVLVITGKGGVRRERGGDEGDFMHGSDGTGVLKRAVPRWLAEADLRAIVVGFGEASARHGGGGAYYVQVRKGR